ncbi:MAG: Na/Pi cotransporter family protein [Clostridiales bacterium]|nr:Na/Pi cotransporter family protein [Clostridiales bacterium]
MSIFSVLTLIGGLCLFLFGMNVMGEGLVKVSGSKLDSILERLTSNRFKAVILGTAVTAVIQSSSATTVMVVGFVNSGIMKLTQAVGVIMGANIGTTVTSWLLSLTGISGSGVVVSMFKPSSFSPILAVIGIIMYMSAGENVRKKDIGSILLGFAVLMFGMSTMSSSVEPLTQSERFTSILLMFSNPVLGVLAGTALTAVIQSSSASVGILQALCLTGVVPYSAALPIIMGQNIGTCVTAIISSVGGGKNAKRTAMMHLYFNLISTVVFLALFYTINHFVHFAFLGNAATAAGIAVIHSLFNIGACVVWFPFANFLVRLATVTIPEKKGEDEKSEKPGELAVLDDRFLEKPGYAVQISKATAVRMAELTRTCVEMAIDLVRHYSKDTADQIMALEDKVDHYNVALSAYLMKISNKYLWANDSKQVSIMLQCVRDFERISDHATNIKYSMDDLQEADGRITSGGMKELMVYARAVQDILDLTIRAFKDNDLKEARNIEPFESVIDSLSIEMKQRHVDRLRRGKCTLEAGMILEDIITDLERMSDHCSNIGVCMLRISSGDNADTQLIMDQIVAKNDDWFRGEYSKAYEKYVLPTRKIQETDDETTALPDSQAAVEEKPKLPKVKKKKPRKEKAVEGQA